MTEIKKEMVDLDAIDKVREEIEQEERGLRLVKRLVGKMNKDELVFALSFSGQGPSARRRKVVREFLKRDSDEMRLLPDYQKSIMNTVTDRIEDKYNYAFKSLSSLQVKAMCQVVLSSLDKCYRFDGWLINDDYRLEICVDSMRFLFNVRVNLPHQVKIVYDFLRRALWVPMMGVHEPYRFKNNYGNLSVKLLEVENSKLQAVYDHGEIRDAKTVYDRVVSEYNQLGRFEKLRYGRPGKFEDWYKQAVKPDVHYVGDPKSKQRFFDDVDFQRRVLSALEPELAKLEACFNRFWSQDLGYNKVKFGKYHLVERS